MHTNLSLIILTPTWFEDWTDLLLQLYAALSPAAKAQLAAEVIFLTHNEALHETNLGWHPKAEELLWRPDLQEPKLSQNGQLNVRYRANQKRMHLDRFLALADRVLPYCRVRHAPKRRALYQGRVERIRWRGRLLSTEELGWAPPQGIDIVLLSRANIRSSRLEFEMVDDNTDVKVSFPYMTAAQWFGVRAKLRQSVPKAIDIDWIMSALGTSEKGARNILPQLKAVGLVTPEGSPSELALDLRDDDTYGGAAHRILEALYPASLRSAYDDPTVEASRVASWFMRNAKTGQATASMQAKLYLTLLRGELPNPEEARSSSNGARKAKETAAKPAAPRRARDAEPPPADGTPDSAAVGYPAADGSKGADGPSLHIDLQVHISADAGPEQIDAVFASMAKHLYGR